MLSIKNIKKIRTILLIYDTLLLFIAHRIILGNKSHIIESIEIALLGFILNIVLWSDWLYFKEINEKENTNVNYNLFHIVGLIFVILYSLIIHVSAFNDLFGKN
jgi:hypothetical protein